MIRRIWASLHWGQKHLILGTGINLAAAVLAHLLIDVHWLTPWLWLAGGGFYTVHEVRQWRQKKWWDWRGFLWPWCGSLACFVVLLAQ